MWCGLIKSIAIRCLVSYPTLLNPTNFDDAVYTYLGGVWEWELTIKVYNDHKPQIKKKEKEKLAKMVFYTFSRAQTTRQICRKHAHVYNC